MYVLINHFLKYKEKDKRREENNETYNGSQIYNYFISENKQSKDSIKRDGSLSEAAPACGL